MGKGVLVGAGVAAFAFAAGLSIGLVMGGGESDPVAAPEVEATRADEAAESERESSATAEQASGARRRSRETARASVHVPESLGALKPGLVVDGNGVIKGHVRDDSGDPIAGATINAFARRPTDWKHPGRDAAFEDQLEYSARSIRFSAATRRTATSGSDGAFELTDLMDREYSLQASAPGWGLRLVDHGHGYKSPGDTADWIGQPQTRVTFRIVGPDGKVVPTAQIEMKRDNGTQSWGWRSSSPTLSLPPMDTTITAIAGEFGELRSEPQVFTIERGDGERTVELTLVERPGIIGRITVEGPAVDHGVHLRMMRVAEGKVPTPQQIRDAGTTAWAHSHNNFAYGFPDLTPGWYAVGAGRDSRKMDVVEVVELGESAVRLDLIVPDWDRDKCVEIVALDPDGKPVTDLGVSLSWKRENGSSSRGVTIVKRADGALWAPFVDDHDPKTGTHTVHLTSQRWGQAIREYTPGPGARVEVQFVTPARATVVVPGYLGSAVDGRVEIGVRQPGERWSRHSVKIDGEGRAVLDPLSPGEYEIVLQIASQSHFKRALGTQTVTLASGESDVVLPIPALYSLTVQLSGDVAGRRIHLTSKSAPSIQPIAPDENGRCVIDLLPAGAYWVRVRGGKDKPREITIPGTLQVDF